MVQRTKAQAKRPAGRPSKEPPPAPGGATSPAPGVEARLKAVEQERDTLKSELDAARQRIAALEESRSLVASRIDWVIESLSGVVDRDD
ncbi:MAG: DUF4164 family protein [Hyphomicrobium sp.]|uniref:hypothetical protein n=1 Tax=Hyphomicrobium sp. TaxID=82 RepID=UPI003D10DD13